MKKTVKWIALLMSMCLLMTGCGNKTDDKKGNADNPSVTEAGTDQGNATGKKQKVI